MKTYFKISKEEKNKLIAITLFILGLEIIELTGISIIAFIIHVLKHTF